MSRQNHLAKQHHLLRHSDSQRNDNDFHICPYCLNLRLSCLIGTIEKTCRNTPRMECIVDPEIGAILSNLTQALTAIGVIATAVSSFANRRKLNTMNDQIIAAAVAAGMAAEKAKEAAANTEVIVAKADEAKAQLAEVREAAVAVNAEVIDRIKNGERK